MIMDAENWQESGGTWTVSLAPWTNKLITGLLSEALEKLVIETTDAAFRGFCRDTRYED